MADENIDVIYVDLDALLDTRIGTLAKLNPRIAEEVVNSDTYHVRDIDDFPGINRELFLEEYSKRDIDTLKNSLVTNCIGMLKDMLSQLAAQQVARPFAAGTIVEVNYWPYKLDVNEIDAMFKAIGAWLGSEASIRLVNYPPDKLTPKHCKETYGMLIKYDYSDWLEAHAQAFLKVQLPEVTLLAPAIYFKKKPSAAELEKMLKDSGHPLQVTEFGLSSLVGFKFIDVKFFSVISP